MRPHRTRVKFCGMRTVDDVRLAVEAGADAVGFIITESPRRVSPAELAQLAGAIPPLVARIAVVANPGTEDILPLRGLGFTLQFSGEELPSKCEGLSEGRPYVKAFHIRADTEYDPADFDALDDYVHATWMFDSRVDDRYGGTGVPFKWSILEGVVRRRNVIVSGGLKPENVGACVRALRPYAVDVRSGVESADLKDIDKMRAFVRAVKEADAEA